MPSSSADSLWHAFSDDLLRFIRRRVDDDATAEDLRQEVFLRIQTNLHQVEDERRIAGWVYQIARNCIVDHFRARRHELLGDSEQDMDETHSKEHDHELGEHLGAWLMAQVGTLPEPYRDAVELVEIQGKSQVDAARELGLSVSGAKSRVQRGRAKLRQALDACCQVELDRRGNVLEVSPRPQCC